MMKASYINYFNSLHLAETVIGKNNSFYPFLSLALFTAEGFLRFHSRSISRGICDIGNIIFHSYVRWIHKAGISSCNNYFDKKDDGYLASCLDSFKTSLVSSGFTHSISEGVLGTADNRLENHLFFESIISASTAGLFFDDETAFVTACEVSYLTSGDNVAAYNAGFIALLINHLKKGIPMEKSINNAKEIADRFFVGSTLLKEVSIALDCCKSENHIIEEKIKIAFKKEPENYFTVIITAFLSSFFEKKIIPYNLDLKTKTAINTISADMDKIDNNFDYIEGEWIFKYPAW